MVFSGLVAVLLSGCLKPDPRLDTRSPQFDRDFYKADFLRRAQSAPAREIRVEKAEVVPVTSLEAFEGYDTAVDLVLSCEKPPFWWNNLAGREKTARGEVFSSASKVPALVRLQTAQSLRVPRGFQGETRQVSARYALRLQGKKGPLTLRDEMPFFFGTTPIPGAVFRVEVPVLRAGETKTAPIVDKTPVVRIEKILAQKTGQSVRLQFRAILTGALSHFGTKSQVVDARGKVWPLKPRFELEFDDDSDLRIQTFHYDLSQIPREAGALRVVGFLYNGESWPAPFSVPVRGANGQILARNQNFARPANRQIWRVVSTQVFAPFPNSAPNARRLSAVIEALEGERAVGSHTWQITQEITLQSGARRFTVPVNEWRIEGAYSAARRIEIWHDFWLPREKNWRFPLRASLPLAQRNGAKTTLEARITK